MNSMRNSGILLSVLVLITAMVTISARAGDEDAPRTDINDTTAVMAAMAQFDSALNALLAGDAGPMEQVWSQREDIAYMGPLGLSVLGWKNFSEHLNAEAAQHRGGEIRSQRLKAILGSKLAFVHADEVGYHKTAGGERRDLRIRATSVFRKEDGQWKMISHHTDIAPSMQN